MAHALAKSNQVFIRRRVRSGRFNNQSEVVSEALRRMEREDLSYLNPPPLTPEQAEAIHGPNPEEEAKERAFATAALRALRRSRRSRKR
jgi:Arc/MetJ-type ribon-helix-helix transcriptional regulator